MTSTLARPSPSGDDHEPGAGEPLATAAGHRSQRRADPLPRLAGSWGQELYSALIKLEGRIALAHRDDLAPDELAELSAAAEQLAQVLEIATSGPRLWSGQRLVEWWTGSRVETCWSLVHQAEYRLVGASTHGRSYAAAMESALAHAQQLDANDPARKHLEALGGVHPAAPA